VEPEVAAEPEASSETEASTDASDATSTPASEDNIETGA
jgi:hypothetical protein